MEFNIFYEMGHSWIEAKLKDVFKFNVEDEISSQSRIEGSKIFLDVDFDARSFLEKIKSLNPSVKFRIKENKKLFKSINDKDRYSKELAIRKLSLV